MRKKVKGLPVQRLIAGTIILCVLAMLSIVLVQGYRGGSAALVAAANDSARQLAAVLNERARRLISPAENVIRVLAHSPLAEAEDMDARLQHLPVLAEVLRSNPMLSAVYIGYDDGEFLLLRPLQRETPRIPSAPADAAYLLQSIARDDHGQLRGRWFFLDGQLQPELERSTPDYWFDPRLRPWYRNVIEPGELNITDPYVFFTTGEVGVSLAVRAHGGGAVIGMDAALDDLAMEVRDLRLTSGTELAIHDDQAGVIAYPEPHRVLKSDGAGFRLARLDELGVEPLARTAAPPVRQRRRRRFQVDGKLCARAELPLRGFEQTDARILIAIPAWELLAEAREVLAHQAALALLLVILVLLLGWVLGVRLGGSIRQLSGWVHALAAFELSAPAPAPSRVREVNELRQAISQMVAALGHFQAITTTLSRELELDRMLPEVLKHLVEMADGPSGVVYLCDEENDLLELAAVYGDERYRKRFTLSESLRRRGLCDALDACWERYRVRADTALA